jgi:hypothetical protein
MELLLNSGIYTRDGWVLISESSRKLLRTFRSAFRVSHLHSTMHHCLEITEILYNIFNSFEVFASHSNFLSLALVSKAFHEPALDVLWKFQRSLLPLIKTFPADVWEEEGDPSTLVSQSSSLTLRSLTYALVFPEDLSRIRL